MPPADASEPASLVVAGLVLVSGLFLGWRQWREYQTRPKDLSQLDENHFGRQDIRRMLGTIVLLFIALGIVLGGRMPAKWGGQANLKFVQLWAGVAFLIVVLLILAMLDWFSTRLYARRHRQRLTNEGLSIVEAELRIKTVLRRAQQEVSREDFPPECK